MAIYGLTRSSEIIDLLTKFSLRDLKHLDNLCYVTWTKYDMEKNDDCPEELAEYLPGVAIMDNDDFQDDILTGAETSHQTNVMLFQPEDTFDKVIKDREKLTLAKSFEIKEIAAEEHKQLNVGYHQSI